MNSAWPQGASLGEIIRKQRELAQLPMRQLAAMSGISNPYLSQIERGLRDPSDQVLESIADSLELSAEALRPRKRQSEDNEESPVELAIQADPDLTAQQRKALQESYRAFRELTIERRRNKGRSRS
jgi:transcriptional regulator with XRE-family HTH domain